MKRVKYKTNQFISLLIGISIILSVSGIPCEIFGQPKNFSVFGVAAISLVGVLMLPIAKKSVGTFTRIDIASVCFMLFYLVDFIHFGSLWNIGCLSLLLLFIAIRMLKPLKYTPILICCILSAQVLTVWGYLQLFEYIPSNSKYFLLTGPFHNPAILAVMLALLAGIIINVTILYYHFLQKHHFMLVWMISTVAFCFPILILTYARAAYITLLASVLYVIGSKLVHDMPRRKKLLCIVGVALIILLSAGAMYTLKPQSAKGRLLVWRVSCQMIQDKPLTGFGKGGFAANYLYYQAEYLKSSASLEEKWVAGSTHLAFNEPLRIAVEHGVPGLLVYLVTIIWLLILSKRTNLASTVSRSLLAGIVIWGLFAYPNQVFSVLLLWTISISCCLSERALHYKHSSKKVAQVLKIAIFIACCSAIMAGRILYVQWQAYHNLHTLLLSHKARNISERINIISGFENTMADDIGFAYYYCEIAKRGGNDSILLHALHLLEKKFPTPGILVLKGDYWKTKGQQKLAESAYKQAAEMVPTLQTPRGRLVFLYYEMNRRSEASALAHELLTEEIKVYDFDTFILHRDLKRIFEDKLK